MYQRFKSLLREPIFFLFFTSVIFAVIKDGVFANINPKNSHSSISADSIVNLQYPSVLSIDEYDSIKFHLPDGFINGNFIDVPVSISSDEIVYALDFALKFNEQHVVFDSILNLTPGLQYLYHFNMNDSILRFTSSSFIPIPNDSVLMLIRFNSLIGQMCAFDLDSLEAYLNGDLCSAIATGCLISGLAKSELDKHTLKLYPNPVQEELFIETEPDSVVEMFDILGTLVYRSATSNKGRLTISVKPFFSPGTYIIRSYTTKSIVTQKIVVSG